MFDKMKEVMKMRKDAMVIRKKLRNIVVTSQEAGGMIEIKMDGEQTVQNVTILPDLLKPEKKADLERYIKNVVNDAVNKTQKLAAQETKGMLNF